MNFEHLLRFIIGSIIIFNVNADFLIPISNRSSTTVDPPTNASSVPSVTIYTNISPSKRWIGIYDGDNSYTWHEAETYCNTEYGTSLASYHNYNDELEVSNARYDYSQTAWIGLTDENSESSGEGGEGGENEDGAIGTGWEWSDGSCYNYEVNWHSNEPNNQFNEDYATFRGNNDNVNDLKSSSSLNSFICNYVRFTISDVGYYTGVYSVDGYNFNWNESELFCNNYFDSHLASTISKHEEADASSARISAANDRAWVGLKNEVSSIANAQWIWSDGTPYHSHQVSWSPGQPDYNNEQCVHFWEDSEHIDLYNNLYCGEELREFICDAPQCNKSPTNDPTTIPTTIPTVKPTTIPTTLPTVKPTPYPTIEPTEEPTEIGNDWIKPCLTDPCDCKFDNKCKICHNGQGCSQCIGTNGEYFKLDWNYPCEKCTDIFGEGCKFCQDFNGCGQCKDGYNKKYDENNDLYYCEKEKSGHKKGHKNNNNKKNKKEREELHRCQAAFGDGCLDCNQFCGCLECDESNGYSMVTGNDEMKYCEQNVAAPLDEGNSNYNSILDVNVDGGASAYSYSNVMVAFVGGIVCSCVLYMIYSQIKQFCIRNNKILVGNTEYQPLL